MSGEHPLQAVVVASIDVFLDSVRSELKKALESLQKVCNLLLLWVERNSYSILALGTKIYRDSNPQDQEDARVGI